VLETPRKINYAINNQNSRCPAVARGFEGDPVAFFLLFQRWRGTRIFGGRVQLRKYQQSFVEAVEKGWSEFKKQLGVAPTGSGKTIIFSHLCNRLLQKTGGKSLILAHRDELIDQAIDKLHEATGIVAEKEKADFRATKNAPVVVASIQTMIRRKENWPKDHFDLVVCDEAHHSISKSWRAVLSHFDGHANVLGVTATPDRGDKRSLGQYYENVAGEISLLSLIKDGFLSNITIRSVPIKIDLNEVHSIAGDLDSGELGHVLEPYLGEIARSIKTFAGNRKTLCFLPLIDTSQKFVACCREAGITAKHIDGESDDRKERLAEFARGEFQLLSNAMLLTEGYDCPGIACVVVLRPTQSRPLFAQMVGRGTRICAGKENLLLLDFLWLHERHKIVHPASLIAASEEEADNITEMVEDKCDTMPDDVVDSLDLIELADTAREERANKLVERLKALADRKSKFITAEQFAMRHHNLAAAEFEPTMAWHSKPMTEKQAIYIERAGINVDTVKGKGQASQLLDLYFADMNRQPASAKQKWVMRQRGWMSADGMRNASSATVGEARDFFAAMNKK
jgi:superfamily II DNA or RNA helicase